LPYDAAADASAAAAAAAHAPARTPLLFYTRCGAVALPLRRRVERMPPAMRQRAMPRDAVSPDIFYYATLLFHATPLITPCRLRYFRCRFAIFFEPPLRRIFATFS